jgi:glucose-1-phosphate adenylyltransferase
MWLFETAVQDGIEDFLILSGDHLYRCNYQDFVRKHRETGSDITVAALPCDPTRASAFGLMKIDGAGRITSFAEKPTGDALKAMEVDTTVLGLDADKAAVRICQYFLYRLDQLLCPPLLSTLCGPLNLSRFMHWTCLLPD